MLWVLRVINAIGCVACGVLLTIYGLEGTHGFWFSLLAIIGSLLLFAVWFVISMMASYAFTNGPLYGRLDNTRER